jgi:hypothetical protein
MHKVLWYLRQMKENRVFPASQKQVHLQIVTQMVSGILLPCLLRRGTGLADGAAGRET